MDEGKVSLLGGGGEGSAETLSWFRLTLSGVAFGGLLSLLRLFAQFLRLTAFLLFVPNIKHKVLTIAPMRLIRSRDTGKSNGTEHGEGHGNCYLGFRRATKHASMALQEFLKIGGPGGPQEDVGTRKVV